MRLVVVGGDDLATDFMGLEAVAGERPAAPWDWLPDAVPFVGLQFDAELPRVWFVGRPVGFQRQVLQQLLDDAARGGGPVSPLVRSTVAAIATPLDLAILTVPS